MCGFSPLLEVGVSSCLWVCLGVCGWLLLWVVVDGGDLVGMTGVGEDNCFPM